MLRLTTGFVFLFGAGVSDTYCHNPRCSNNRLNEKSANRNNGDRIFDSQNNNRGGYNVGETGTNNNAFDNGDQEATWSQMYDVSNAEDNGDSHQYNMLYQAGSKLRLTWTSQHGCGNAMNNCQQIFQFGCDNVDYTSTNIAAAERGLGIRMQLHDGGNTGTSNAANSFENNQLANTIQQNANQNRGIHESEDFYTFCQQRKRNEGLFTADQNLKGDTQKYTRQNPNGQRRGQECPEERDYYPHWMASPWRDIVVLTKDVEYCKSNIAPHSMNVEAKGSCTETNANTIPTDNNIAAQTNADDCATAGGVWVTKSWGQQDSQAWRDALCQESQWSSVNHLGNVDKTNLGGQMASYEWTIPNMAMLTDQWGCHEYTASDGTKYIRGVIRTRYNISTMDYDPYNTTSAQNNDPNNGVISPVTQNPTIDVGAYMQGLRLALNTAQTGRTFQDRSHVFNIFAAPAAAMAAQQVSPMLNVNVRGKRGNIVQTFPAVEYDFEPNDITMSQQQCLHFQWTGSNTHNNGNPGGDGQTGDAGEGQGGTDRSNIMELNSLRTSYPKAYDVTTINGQAAPTSFFDVVSCKYPLTNNGDAIPADLVKAIMASAGYFYYNPATGQLNTVDNSNDDALNPLLNNVSASFKQGLVCCTNANTPAGEYYMVSTRNNNFTNRSQKMKITVVAGQGTQFGYFQSNTA